MLIALLLLKETTEAITNLYFLIAVCFASIIYLIFNFKRFDLIKKYYDETIKNKE